MIRFFVRNLENTLNFISFFDVFVVDKVEYDELEDYISEILYNEFNTIVEDGSLVKVCKNMASNLFFK